MACCCKGKEKRQDESGASGGTNVVAVKEKTLALPKKAIGSGGTADVFIGQWSTKSGLIPVAVKQWKSVSDESDKEEFSKERRLLSTLKHEHVVRLYGYIENARQLSLVMEVMAKGSLKSYLHQRSTSNRPLTLAEAVSVLTQISDALHYLFGLSIVHADVHTGNILVTEDGPNIVAKVADFELAQTIEEHSTLVMQSQKEDVLGFSSIIDEVMMRAKMDHETHGRTPQEVNIVEAVQRLTARCKDTNVSGRPLLDEVFESLKAMHEDLVGTYVTCTRISRALIELSSRGAIHILITGTSQAADIKSTMSQLGLGQLQQRPEGDNILARNVQATYASMNPNEVNSNPTNTRYKGLMYIMNASSPMDLAKLKDIVDSRCIDKSPICLLIYKTGIQTKDVLAQYDMFYEAINSYMKGVPLHVDFIEENMDSHMCMAWLLEEISKASD